MSSNMGLGTLGANEIVFRSRKIRWTVSGEFGDTVLPEVFVKLNARPSLDLEEIQVKSQEDSEGYFPDGDDPREVITYVPKEQSWNEITTTYYEISNETTQILGKIWSEKNKGTLHLRLYDGCGCLLETWELRDAYPSSVQFSEIDFSTSELADIEITWRYKSGKYQRETPVIYGFKTPERHVLGGVKDHAGYYVTPSEPTPPSGPAPTSSTS